MHPAGKVHLTSGVLPRKSLQLARDWVQPGLAVIAPSVRVGPVLLDADQVRLPKVSSFPKDQLWTRRDTPSTWKRRSDPRRHADGAAARHPLRGAGGLHPRRTEDSDRWRRVVSRRYEWPRSGGKADRALMRARHAGDGARGFVSEAAIAEATAVREAFALAPAIAPRDAGAADGPSRSRRRATRRTSGCRSARARC